MGSMEAADSEMNHSDLQRPAIVMGAPDFRRQISESGIVDFQNPGASCRGR